MKTQKWQVDECPDANNFYTIRYRDDTKNGDITNDVIATVYKKEHAQLIVKLFNNRTVKKVLRKVNTTHGIQMGNQ